mgnify:CR=1 FL=1
MGWCGSMSHGFVRGERIRHVAWRAAGLCTAIACTLSLFSGLYGSFAMQLSDLIAQRTPVLSLLNPAQQITNLFYDILYYDNFKPFFTTAGILAAMSLVCLAAATVLLRRQRYEYL